MAANRDQRYDSETESNQDETSSSSDYHNSGTDSDFEAQQIFSQQYRVLSPRSAAILALQLISVLNTLNRREQADTLRRIILLTEQIWEVSSNEWRLTSTALVILGVGDYQWPRCMAHYILKAQLMFETKLLNYEIPEEE